MKTIKAKFNLTAVKNEDGTMAVSGQAVIDPNGQNKIFNDEKPTGNFYIHIAEGEPAQELFEHNITKPYFIEISSAENDGAKKFEEEQD